MIRFVLLRIGSGILVIWGIVTLLFAIFNLMGDPSETIRGQRSDIATAEAVSKKYRLDQPVAIRYLYYLNDLSPVSYYGNGDTTFREVSHLIIGGGAGNQALVLKFPYFNRSFQTNRTVGSMIAERLPGTGILAGTSMLFASLFGIAFGLVAALKRNSLTDRSILAFTLLGISVPSFFAAILLIWIFALVLGEFTGLRVTGYIVEPEIIGDGYVFHPENLVLPALALGIRPLAIVTQLTRSSMLESIHCDFVRTARAKGLHEFSVNGKHALRTALNPVLTSISGWFASLLAGSFFVEYIFNWHGIGQLMISALESFDYPVVMGCAICTGIIFVTMNIAVDLLYRVLDPRVNSKE